MEYIHIKNLEKYHPGYKDRDLIWCKTYFTMLNADPDFELLSEIDKWRFVAFVMLELQCKKPIPLDKIYLTRKGFDFKKRRISLTLQMLQGFIEVVTGNEKSCNRNTDKEVDKEKEKDKEKERALPFAPPSFQDVSGYAKSIKYDTLDPQGFIDFYQAKGWMIGKNKMKDWKAAVRTWKKREPPKPETSAQMEVRLQKEGKL